jgi:hypothetical protein
MGTRTSFDADGALVRVLTKARNACATIVYERTVLLLACIFCVGVAAILWHLSRLSTNLVQSGALQATSIYSQSITDLRTFYMAPRSWIACGLTVSW